MWAAAVRKPEARLGFYGERQPFEHLPCGPGLAAASPGSVHLPETAKATAVGGVDGVGAERWAPASPRSDPIPPLGVACRPSRRDWCPRVRSTIPLSARSS